MKNTKWRLKEHTSTSIRQRGARIECKQGDQNRQMPGMYLNLVMN